MEYTGLTIKEILIMIVGEYTPTLSPDGEVLGGIFSLDFAWIFGALLVIIAFISVVLCAFYTVALISREFFYGLRSRR